MYSASCVEQSLNLQAVGGMVLGGSELRPANA